jgi:hypothetical protein
LDYLLNNPKRCGRKPDWTHYADIFLERVKKIMRNLSKCPVWVDG